MLRATVNYFKSNISTEGMIAGQWESLCKVSQRDVSLSASVSNIQTAALSRHIKLRFCVSRSDCVSEHIYSFEVFHAESDPHNSQLSEGVFM